MPLNENILKATPELSGLSEAQLKAITTLSANDENTVIGQKIGEIYGKLDIDIKDTFGVEKGQGEKTYDYLKRAGKSLTEKVKELPTQLETLKKEKEELEKKIGDGKGGEVIQQKLKDAEARLKELENKYEKDTTELKGKIGEYSTLAQKVKIDYEFERALTGKAFKPEVPEDLQKILVSAAKQKILSELKADWIDNGKGGQVLVFRDEKGQIRNNPENKLNPYSAGELLVKELATILSTPGEGGAGTGKPNAKTGERADLSGAKTQVDADELIVRHLLAKGLKRGSSEFADEHKKMRIEAKVAEMPIR